MRYTLFISDLHLNALNTVEFANFQRLLQIIPHHKIDALYILGDFFELWIGDDIHAPLVTTITQLLRQTSQYCSIYFMPGNRDFLLSKRFVQNCEATLLADPSTINLYGIPTLLLHGDSLCTDDVRYQRWRKISRMGWLQRLFLTLPRAYRYSLAQKIRQQSQMRYQSLTPSQSLATEPAIQKMLQTHKVLHIIHGHTHQPLAQMFYYHNHWCYRWVLGDWQWQAHALVCTPQHSGENSFFFVNI